MTKEEFNKLMEEAKILYWKQDDTTVKITENTKNKS
jgi:hypothetical protein